MITRQLFQYRMYPGGEHRIFLLMPEDAAMYVHRIREGIMTVEECFINAAGERPGACEIRLIVEYLDKPIG
jgi:hypothetical protein